MPRDRVSGGGARSGRVPRRPAADDGFDTGYRVPREGDDGDGAGADGDGGEGFYGSGRGVERDSSDGGGGGGGERAGSGERSVLRGSGGGLRVAWEGEEDPPPASAVEPVERDRFGRPISRPAAGRGKDRPIGSSLDTGIGSSLDSKFGSGERFAAVGGDRYSDVGDDRYSDVGGSYTWNEDGSWDEDNGYRGSSLDDDFSASVANYVADEW